MMGTDNKNREGNKRRQGKGIDGMEVVEVIAVEWSGWKDALLKW